MIRRASFTSACIVLLISVFPSIATSSSHTLSTLSTAPFDPYVHRSNFIVGDLDRALRIYRDILGFKVNVVLPVQEQNFMRTIFKLPPDAKMRIAFLSGVKGQFGHIGITEVKGADISSSEGGPFPSVLILEVQRDLESLHKELKTESSDVSEIFDLRQPDRREFMFTDHDGHRVLIMRLAIDKSD